MSQNHPSTVVAVVLNWCSQTETQSCVSALLREPQLRVLVVDNASPDGSGEALKAWVETLCGNDDQLENRATFVQSGANLGYAGGNSFGIRWALERGAEWVLVVNPDVVPEVGLVPQLLDAAMSAGPSKQVAAVCPTLLATDRAGWANYAGGHFDVKRALGSPVTGVADVVAPRNAQPRGVTFLHGGCVLLSAKALRSVGAFREDYFMYVEDAELSLRLHQAGWSLLHQPKVRVLHAGDEFDNPVAWKIYLRDRNRRKLAAEHYRLWNRMQFLLWFYPSRLAHVVRYVWRADGARARAVWQGMFGRLDKSTPGSVSRLAAITTR